VKCKIRIFFLVNVHEVSDLCLDAGDFNALWRFESCSRRSYVNSQKQVSVRLCWKVGHGTCVWHTRDFL